MKIESIVFKCDRCGKEISKNVRNCIDSFELRHDMIIGIFDMEGERRADLCQDCKEEFVIWWTKKGEPNE